MCLGQTISGGGSTREVYHFDGNTNDSSGNGLNGTPTAVTYINQQLIQSAVFVPGSGSQISLPNGIVNGVNTMTVAVTANRQGTASTGDGKIWDARNGSRIFAIISDNSAGYYAVTDFGTNSGNLGSSVIGLRTGEWLRIVLTVMGGTAYLYVNTQLIASGATGTTSWTSAVNTAKIGQEASGSPNRRFNGYMDELIHENLGWDAGRVARDNTFYKGRFGIL